MPFALYRDKVRGVIGVNLGVEWFYPKLYSTFLLQKPCKNKKNRRKQYTFGGFLWQREKDSNPHIRSQSPLCYLYTIPLCSDEQKLLYRF